MLYRQTLRLRRYGLFALAASICVTAAPADDAVDTETRAGLASARYALDGTGVVVAVLDRGIDYTHPDFRNPDGTTRIRYLLDMSGQNLCAGGSAPVEYTKAQIDAALVTGTLLPTRDAVGHGTVTAGLAAGNGTASPDARFAGMAPNADLIIVKLTSEGAPAHGGEPAEAPFQGCIESAMDWLDEKLIGLGDPPCVATINSGTQWGPLDGTSAVSRKIDEIFGLDRPGRVYVSPSGDEGTLRTHARAVFTPFTDAVVPFTITGGRQFLSVWYSGAPAEVAVELDDGAIVGPVAPDNSGSGAGISIFHYGPGNAFYPWTSDGPDHAVWIRITERITSGTVTLSSLSGGSGVVDLTAPDITGRFGFDADLAPGRLTDYSCTQSAVVAACHVVRNNWTDIDGFTRTFTSEGSAGEVWRFSSPGPTRDGRRGVAISAPGHNAFAAYAPNSWWATARANIHRDGNGLYGRASATSASGPIVAGVVALMLQMDPRLTAREAIEFLGSTAAADAETGPTPNELWGAGKLDVLAALDGLWASVCPADLDGPIGILDLGDLSAFVQSFLGQQPPADFNSDGLYDLADISIFVASFTAGCP